MSAGPAGSRRPRFRGQLAGRFSRTTIGLTTAAAVIVLVGGIVATAPRATPPTTGSASPTPSGVAVGPSPTAGWTPLTLADLPTIADLTPSAADADGIPTDATFTLISHTTASAVELAGHLVSEPTVDLRVAVGPTPEIAIVTPTAPLDASTRYRFRLSAPDGTPAGSWAFETTGPLHVIGRLPDNKSTDVPVDTGIELTFDRPGTAGVPAHFTISPSAKGAFEQHDATWSFVPSTPLEQATLYTVTVSAGVSLPGSNATLEAPVSWSFETERTSGGSDQPTPRFDRSLFDVVPGARPVLGVSMGYSEIPAPATLPIRAYRLPTAAAAIAALRAIDTAVWAVHSDAGLVDTTALDRVLSANARLTRAEQFSGVLELPGVLAAGWYLVVIPNDERDTQAVVQVTRLAVYAVTSTTRTIAWVNDIVSGAPVADATVALPGGAAVGRTAASGLLDTTTPSSLLATAAGPYDEPEPQYLTVRASGGRASVVDLGQPSGGRYPFEDRSVARTDAWWNFLMTDRTDYRPTDTIHAWGVIRARSDRHVPSQVELRVAVVSDDPGAPILRKTVTPRATGAFLADLPIDRLPTGEYNVQAFVGGEVVATEWFEVADIRKPAYELTLTPSRHALIRGDSFGLKAQASFFDGSRVPGLDLLVAPLDDGGEVVTAKQQTLTTNATGVATARFVATNPADDSQRNMDLQARPNAPEEGEITGTASLLVFPSSLWLTGTATIERGRLVVGGRLTTVDLAKVERTLAAARWLDDPSGKAVAGHAVRLSIVHLVPVRKLVRTDYDYVEKKAVPVYETDFRRETLSTRTLTSSTTGAFSLSLPVPVVDDQYQVTVSATDAKHRRLELVLIGERPVPYVPFDRALWLSGSAVAHVGQPVSVSLQRRTRAAGAGTYLFIVAHDGIEAAVLQSSPTFRRTFREADLPNIAIRGVSFTSFGYEVAGDDNVGVAITDRTVTVRLAADRPRYQPGDTARISIVTTLHGRPVAADVVVRAVDQKLYAIGAAGEIDTVGSLMRWVGPGFMQSYTAQFLPGLAGEGGGYGDGGGDARSDFRDVATFQVARTDARGRASVSFKLPDDLTGWHVSAGAVTSRLEAGDGSLLLAVGLPFFVDATLASEYLVGEQPVLTLRAYGDALPAKAPVRFTISAPSLGLAGVSVDGTSFTAVRVPLPALPAGDHSLTISAARLGASGTDSLIRTVHVVPTRVTALVGSFEPLTPGYRPAAGAGLATYVVTDAGRGALIPLLESLADADGARFERAAAAELARRLLVSEFQMDASVVAAGDFDRTRYQHGDGVAILPYASPSLDTAVRGAIVAADLLDTGELRSTFHNARHPDPDLPAIGADADLVEILAGQAAIGDDVLADLRQLRATTLDTRLEAWLALAFLESGDEATARQLEREILRAHGQAFGPVVRVEDGGETHRTTAVMLLVAAGLGDPLASSMSRYLDQYADRDETFAIEQVGYARSMLEHLPRVAGRFAWTVDGGRHEVGLDPGGAFSMALTPAQQSSFRLDPISGDMTVASLRNSPLTASSFDAGSQVSLARTVTPANDAPADRIVLVSIVVTMGADAPKGCYRVTDTAPSGLAPLGATAAWPDDTEVTAVSTRPYQVSGQRVSWCVDDKTPMPLVYAARVISPGTYVWEPAVIQLETAPRVGAATDSVSYTIR